MNLTDRPASACRLLILIAVAIALPIAADAQPVAAKRQMVATANPMASQAALDVLRAGGTAVDAAIAAQTVLAVVEPQSSGLGGGSLMLTWNAATKELASYEGLASAPASMPQNLRDGVGGRTIDRRELERSGRAVGVPGTLRLLALAHAEHGRLPWARLFQDAVRLADDGFALPPYLHSLLLLHPELAKKPGIGPLYFADDGTPLAAGTKIRNPAIAIQLRAVAAEGVEAFYRGSTADRIIRAVAEAPNPGRMTYKDLADYQAKRRDPVCAIVFLRRICSAGPPSAGGIALLQQLAILERVDIANAKPGGALAAHLFIDASRLSEADRRSWLGDPDQVSVPVAGLIDPAYLDGRARLIDSAQALKNPAAGSPARRQGALPAADPIAWPATTHVAAVDEWGDAVSFTTTINVNFGSELAAGGVILNNALTNFADPAEVEDKRAANAAAPGKRPITTMAPSIVFDADGKPLIVIGAGGGARIVDAVALTILGALVWGEDIRTAIEQPRIGGQNRAEELEAGTPAAGLAGILTRMGHQPKVVEMNAAVQAIRITEDGLEGWADPRRDGVALGD